MIVQWLCVSIDETLATYSARLACLDAGRLWKKNLVHRRTWCWAPIYVFFCFRRRFSTACDRVEGDRLNRCATAVKVAKRCPAPFVVLLRFSTARDRAVGDRRQ